MAAAKLRRRSSFLPNRSEALNETPLIEDPALNEEAERKNRMKLQKRQSIGHGNTIHGTPLPNAGENGGAGSSIARCSQVELAQMYADCMKLSAENKISVKNAFQLKMIDYMSEMIRSKRASEMDNFQSASGALDASTKIYAYRVDSVHSDTLKLAGGVGNTKEENDKGNKNDQDADNVEDMETEDGEKKKVKRKKKAATVEKNIANIDIAKFDLEFDVDPLFKKTSTQFDSGSGGGQFLCNLFLRDESCQLLLDSEAFLNPQGQELSPEEDLQEDMMKIETLDDAVICPSFSKFSFKNWSVENEDPAFLNLSLKDNEDADESLKQLDDDQDNQEHVFDVNAPPVEDLNPDFSGNFMDHHDDHDDNTNGPTENLGANNRGLGMELVAANMKARLTSIPSEYSYFDNGRLGAWAGPKHWKFKPTRGPTFAIPGVPKKDKKKDKDPIKPHDFDELFDEENDLWKVVLKTTKLNAKPMQLQNKTMVNWSEDKLLLPTDLHYKGKDFAKLFSTPELLVTSKGVLVPESVDDSINEYDYDNPNDADDFCPNLPENGESGNYEDAGFFPSQTMLPTQSQDPENLLVSAPNRVEKLQIGYAKQAKKMDMRRLKAVEWSILQTTTCEQDKENDKTKVNDANTTDNDQLSNCNFSQLYKNLSGSKLMPTKMSENLSVPLAFVALLHLCNERCLALDGLPDFSDFNIAQG